MRTWLPAGGALLQMIAIHLLSPMTAQKKTDANWCIRDLRMMKQPRVLKPVPQKPHQ